MAETKKTLVERLFTEQRGSLQAFLFRRVRRHQDAAELAQEVYVRMLRVPDTAAIRNPESYLYTVASNLAKEHARQESKEAGALDIDDPLVQDQLAELQTLCEALAQGPGDRVGVFTFDGDTPQDARRSIRSRAHVVLSNPDMLHSGILPHHPRWAKLFENLRYIVIDELHAYRGVFGSHLCNVLRRLRRICHQTILRWHAQQDWLPGRGTSSQKSRELNFKRVVGFTERSEKPAWPWSGKLTVRTSTF